MADAEDRTEAASARRLQRARAEGQVPIAPELSALAVLAAAALLLVTAAPAAISRLSHGLAGLFVAGARLQGPEGMARGLQLAAMAMLPVLVGVLAIAAATAAATLLQTGLLLSPAKLKPDLARLNPGRGLKRLFGAANLAGAGKSLLKLALIAAALWHLLRGRQHGIAATLAAPLSALPTQLAALSLSILLTVLGVQTVIAGADLLIARFRHARSLRMSRAEQKEEARESDGSPEVKAKLRRLRSQRARHRMVQAVARATVVVTNPTHYAVALSYDRSRHAAPKVVAKGMDELAARIRAIAEENNVPLVANPPLARALHRVELEADIPAEHYQAVAELIAYVWRLQGQARRRPS